MKYRSTEIRSIGFPEQTGFLPDISGDRGAQTLSAGGTLSLLEQPLIVTAVGRAVRKQRLLKDLSQEALAAKAGVNRKHLSELERGERDLRVSTYYKLALGLELSYRALGAAVDEALASLEGRARPHG